MLKRYSGATGAGIVITAALIYAMQQMIAGGDFQYESATAVRVPMPHMELTPPDPPERTTPPKPPDDPPVQPAFSTVDEFTPGNSRALFGITAPTAPPAISGPRGLNGLSPGALGVVSNQGEMLPMMRATPLYPYAAEIRGLEGRVIVEFTVMPNGRVSNVRIVESTHPVFDKAALEAAIKFRYQPRIVDGSPVAVTGVRTVFDFRLEE